MDSLPQHKKTVLKSGSATTLALWETELDWFNPLPLSGLETTPGLYVPDCETVGYPSDCSVRWMTQYALTMTRRGSAFTDPAQIATYLENPENIWLPSPPFKFVVPSVESPHFVKPSGKSNGIVQSGKATIGHGKRKGLVIDLVKRRKVEAETRMPTNTAPPKYSKVPHPLFELSAAALPAEASEEELEIARGMFSASVTTGTAKDYATAVRHKMRAERRITSCFC